jgi:3-oxoacyl-[acyl-carrier protein] reductase
MDGQETRAALVTGGAGGLGRAIAMELARRGWSVFLQHGGSEKAAEEAASAVRTAALEAGREIDVETAAADLTEPSDREQLVERVLESFGRIDMLVNAAVAQGASEQDLLEMTEDAYRRVMDSTLAAAVFLTQLVANEMVRLVEAGQIEGAKIVTINTINAATSSVDTAPQCLARSALAMMTQLFADRLGQHGISVHEVRVGLLSTGPSDPAHGRYETLIDQGLTPIRRFGRPADVARAVAAVAEDLLDFSTGDVINVDGGFHLRRM